MAVTASIKSLARGKLRPFDIRRDLNSVADLVELCFADTLDRDGQRYLKQMRDAARNSRFLQWASNVVEQASLPLSGYVWEEDGCLVGNLSLIPFYLHGRRQYLIANVAVHPEYRRQGIARALTSKAVEHARAHRAVSAWLHVREENDPATRLYHSLGFIERARRTTWHGIPSAIESSALLLPSTYQVSIRPAWSHHWSLEQAWLKHIYPPEIAWHLPLNWNALQPNLWGGLYRMVSGMRVRHWVALRGEDMLAALAWQNGNSHTDTFWLAAPSQIEGAVITALLRVARQELPAWRSLTLDFPAGQFVQEIQAAGFQARQTLIWMEMPNLDSSPYI